MIHEPSLRLESIACRLEMTVAQIRYQRELLSKKFNIDTVNIGSNQSGKWEVRYIDDILK